MKERLRALGEVLSRGYAERPLLAPASALRVAAWSVLFLVVLAHHLPAEYRSVPARKLQVAVDPQAVYALGADDIELGSWYRVPAKRPGELRIAWIGASNDLVLDRNETYVTLVPQMVQARLAATTTRPVFVLSYQLTAGAPFDKYLAFLHALDQSPDLVVYSVNPIWDFSPVILTWRHNLRSVALPHLGGDWSSLGRFVLLAAPRDYGQAVALALCPTLYSTSETVHQRVLDPILSSLLSRGHGGGVPAVPRREEVMKMDFWIRYGKGYEPQGQLDRQRFMLEHWFEPFSESSGAPLLRHLVELAGRRSVPLVVFSAPLNPILYRSAEARAHLLEVDALLYRLAPTADPQRVTVWNFSREPFLRDRDFYDGIHLVHADRFADLLSEKLARHLDGQLPPRPAGESR